MTTSRQPKGIPVGGQFAATAHAEGAVSLNQSGNPDQLARVTSLLAAEEVQWEQENHRLARESEARKVRRRRLSGARTASSLLAEFPRAATVTYARNTRNGIVNLISVQDADGHTLYDSDDMNEGVLAGTGRDINRRVAARQSVRHLWGQTPPTGYTEQGITVHENDTERLHLQTALTDGLAVLEDEPAPAEASKQRVESALAQWNDPDDAETRVRDMLTDLRHYAAAQGIDLENALEGSYEVFVQEHNDPAFKEGF